MHFKCKILPIDGHNQGTFSQNQKIFFQFSKKGTEDLPPPPFSYTPVVITVCRILLLSKFTIMKLKIYVFDVSTIFL